MPGLALTNAPSAVLPLAARYAAVRAATEALCAGLEAEDFVVQSMPDVSPTKWHLAHTTWFWEQFVLGPFAPDYRPLDARYAFLFNSYYVQAGERHARDQRGYLSRPTVAEVFAYRAHVDAAMARLLDDRPEPNGPLAETVEVGLNHEQQHQELMVTDLKHVFSVNPLRPVYRERPAAPARDSLREPAVSGPARFLSFDAGLHEIGATGQGETAAARFHFDNEGPRHRQFVEAFALADRPVTNGEFAAFVADGGYRTPTLWLSLGWAAVEAGGWAAPFYWERAAPDAPWRHFTLAGMRDLDPHEPVTHVSYFEADAFARWAGARLPTEAEWEVAAVDQPVAGRFVDAGLFHPAAAGPALGGDGAPALRQLYGDVWEWTASPYAAYPGYRPVPGALGEYNGKFMANQFVLRGGSCATPPGHVRRTYRNFFPPEATWQFTGIRLAR